MRYLFTLFLAMFFFTLTYQSSPAEFPTFDLTAIGFLIVVVTAVEFLISRVFARFQLIENYVLAGFTIFNILYLNLIFNEQFADLPRYGQAIALLIGVFIVATLLEMTNGSKLTKKVLPALFAMASIGVALMSVTAVTTTQYSVSNKPGKTTAENVQLVTFDSKPNVYFVSFDALIPKPLLKKHIGLETTDYHEILSANFLTFRNFFSDRVATIESLNSLLALDINYFDETVKVGGAYVEKRFFSGWTPSPLLEIFKHNGYETTTYYHRKDYFGKTKGPFVDNYKAAGQDGDKWRHSTGQVCDFIYTGGIHAPSYLGYCYIVLSKWAQKKLALLDGDFVDQNDALIGHMRDQLKKSTPQIFVSYIFSPGHIQEGQDLINYRETYAKNSATTASYLKNLIDFINEEDPSAILYVFGDHGMWVSQGVDFAKNAKFVVQDRYGVFGGIFPKDRCAKTFSDLEINNETFMTVSKAAHWIIRCLSGGKNSIISPEDYKLSGMPSGVSIHYEDYLYE